MIQLPSASGLNDMASRLKEAGITPETLAIMKALDDPVVRARADLEIRAKPLYEQMQNEDRLNTLKANGTLFQDGLASTAKSFRHAEEAIAREKSIDPFGIVRATLASEKQRAAEAHMNFGSTAAKGVSDLESILLAKVSNPALRDQEHLEAVTFAANDTMHQVVREARERKEREIETLELARRQVIASEAAIESARKGEAAALAKELAANQREEASTARAEKANRFALLGLLIGLASAGLAAWTLLSPRFE